jgi:hypothetical protein
MACGNGGIGGAPGAVLEGKEVGEEREGSGVKEGSGEEDPHPVPYPEILKPP